MREYKKPILDGGWLCGECRDVLYFNDESGFIIAECDKSDSGKQYCIQYGVKFRSPRGLIRELNFKLMVDGVVAEDKTDDKFVSKSGVTSSHCPDFTQIPFEALIELAARYELGQKKHGRDNWRKAVDPDTVVNPDFTPAEEFALERLNHLVRHCYILANQIMKRKTIPMNDDSPQGNIGAILWGASTMPIFCQEIFGDKYGTK